MTTAPTAFSPELPTRKWCRVVRTSIMRYHPMSTTTPLRPRSPTGEEAFPTFARPDGLGRGARYPEPAVEKIRGAKLVALWVGLAAAAWAVVAAVGYGFYMAVWSLFS